MEILRHLSVCEVWGCCCTIV